MTKRKNPDADHVVTSLPTALHPDHATPAAGQTWFRRFWPLVASSALSIAWSGLAIWWFMESGKTLTRMPVYEVGGLLAGATLPLVLIWLIALVYLRTDPLRDHRTALVRGLDGLLAPLDIAQRRVNSIVAELHKEIKHVEAAGDIASTRIESLENRFQKQISSLFEATTGVEAQAANLQASLSAERESLSGLVGDVTTQITELETLFKQLRFDSETLTNTARKNSEKVSNEITFQNKTLEERSKLIEERLEKMAGHLGALSRDISENCDTSEQKLAAIGQFFADKQAELVGTLRAMDGETDQICGKMGDQSRVIADLSQVTAREADKISATLEEQTTNLNRVATDALSRTSACGDAFQAQADAMGRKLDEVTEKSRSLINDASQNFQANSVEIVESSQTLSDSLIAHMGRATEDLYARSETLEHTISARVDAMEAALEKQADLIRGILSRQTEEMQATLEENARKASDFIIREGGMLTENVNEQFGDLFALLEQQTAQLQQAASQSTDKLDATITAIESQAERVDKAVASTTESLDEKTGLMNRHYESFEELSEKFRLQLDQSAQQLRTQNEELLQGISGVGDQVEEALQKLKGESGALGEHTQEIINSIVGQTENLSERIDDIRGRTEHTIRNIQDMEHTVSQHFNATDETATALSENWLRTAGELENRCSETLSGLDQLSEKLAALENENATAAERAESNFLKVSEQMQLASESIHLASASATEAADETSHHIDQHAGKFQQLINAIQLSNKSILADAEAIEQKIREKSGNHFSTLASKILEQLQSLSIDINRYIEGDVPDEVWQSYVKGDKNTFVRRLRKMTSKKHVAAIREKYKTDRDFRKHTLEYMHLFEDLMSQSMASSTYSTYSVALISSETGKVYLALAQATDRLS